jgi:lysozyme
MLRRAKRWQVAVFVGFSALAPVFCTAGEGWVAYELRPSTGSGGSIRDANLGGNSGFPYILRSNPESSFGGALRRPATAWHTNPAAISIIKNAEKLRLNSYFLAGQWLVGYGHAGATTEGMTITSAMAEAFLKADLSSCEDAVGRSVNVPVSRNEFSALVALCYNIGIGNVAKSVAVQRLNQGDRKGAANAFLYWTKAAVNEQPKVLAALVERRKRERILFLKDQVPIHMAARSS